MATVPAEDQIATTPLFDERGLLPCIAQDCESGEVLMFAYMNREALELSRSTRELHLWSRSRKQMWRKGETSGNVMSVRSLRLDCDGDCLLALVAPAGPACHTGQRTCFHTALPASEPGASRPDSSPSGASPPGASPPGASPSGASPPGEAVRELSRQPTEMLPALERTLQSRAAERPEGSYTVRLLDDPPFIGEKVMEEAEEVARAARQESDLRVDEEAADVLYHLLVLLHSRGRRLGDALRVLMQRDGGPRR
jgi:phosphoribosyl-ATP pyrophosphohydrolase/phosphoribosyl-AMP cyclohydrolase